MDTVQIFDSLANLSEQKSPLRVWKVRGMVFDEVTKISNCCVLLEQYTEITFSLGQSHSAHALVDLQDVPMWNLPHNLVLVQQMTHLPPVSLVDAFQHQLCGWCFESVELGVGTFSEGS